MNTTKEDLYNWHVNQRNFDDIGYHYYIKFDGSTFACRDTQYQGAHCKAVNDKSLAICLEGGYNGEYNFTQTQLLALEHLVRMIKVQHPNAGVVGHSHFDNKACPVLDVVTWWESL